MSVVLKRDQQPRAAGEVSRPCRREWGPHTEGLAALRAGTEHFVLDPQPRVLLLRRLGTRRRTTRCSSRRRSNSPTRRRSAARITGRESFGCPCRFMTWRAGADSRVHGALLDALNFLTGDTWEIEFYRAPPAADVPQQGLLSLDRAVDAVIPFSNGLDSCAVAGLRPARWATGSFVSGSDRVSSMAKRWRARGKPSPLSLTK